MKKGQIKLEYLFIGVLLFGLVFVLGLGFLTEALSFYNVQADTSTTFGKMTYNLKAIYDYQDSMKEKIQGGTVTDESAVDEMVKGGYTGTRTGPFNALTIAGNATMTLAQEVGFIDPNILSFLMTIFSIFVLFAIIALIFRFRT